MKKEFIILGTDAQRKKMVYNYTDIGNSTVPVSDSFRNISAHLDKDMSMKVHINYICQSFNFQIRNMLFIRPCLTIKAAKTIATSRLITATVFCIKTINKKSSNFSKFKIQLQD